MAKSLSGLWLKSIRRASKAQQARGRKILKSLLPKAAGMSPVRSLKAVGRTRRPVVDAGARPGRRSATPGSRSDPASLPGSWQKSYFSLPLVGNVGKPRRMLYWLYLPAGASGTPAVPLPLVVMLHGCQQTAPDFATATRMNKLAERKGFAVLYPQQSATADRHRCWHWYKRSTQQGLGEAELVAGMIAQLQRKHALDTTRTYVAGLSAGAALAAIVALRYPALIAAVGLHSAPVFGTSDTAMNAYRVMQVGSQPGYAAAAQALLETLPPGIRAAGLPAIVLHGERDSVVRRINAEQLTAQFLIVNAAAINGAQPQLRHTLARPGGRSPRHAWKSMTYYAGRKPQVVRCDVAALEHAWSGGDQNVPFSTREGPDATLLMWNFFARHQRHPAPDT